MTHDQQTGGLEAPRETEYRYVETSYVTDEELTRLVNLWTGRGWRYDGLSFAMREASKRPAMAFLLFCRARAEDGADAEDAGRGAG